MKRTTVLTHEFVEYIPEVLKPGTIYVSITYATSVHLCCCGCGNEVVTPLSPTDWKLTFDGESISLYPSIGNWSFACHSHYWIKNDKVIWTPRWSRKEINAARVQEHLARNKYYDGYRTKTAEAKTPRTEDKADERLSIRLRRKFSKWFFHKDSQA